MTDLALVGGRVLDPGRGIDGRLDIGVTAGRFGATGDAGPAAETIDTSGLVLVPGLVDLHTHLYAGVSHYGIDPDAHCLRRGVTTAVDAGSAGAQTFPGFRRYVIEPAFRWWQRDSYLARGAKPVRDGFRFASDTNQDWLDEPRLLSLLEEAGA